MKKLIVLNIAALSTNVLLTALLLWNARDVRDTVIAVVMLVVTGGILLWSSRATQLLSSRISRDTGSLAGMAGGVLTAAAQMSVSAQQLSQGSTQQAATLEETSASMEEMAAMTRRNADNAQQAATLVSEVADQVRSSNTALAEMVTSMGAIRDSSDKVARIIKTIDEIAFQTNILALNAAVEAARAGAAGMGFAVVADEVRNLAQRSAQAAKDTAPLIEEAIERSHEGSTRVEQVAGSIGAITASIDQVRAIVYEVREASQQQAQGIDQVSQAVVAMEKATQTTAATAEQSATASEGLKAQAESSMAVVRQLAALVGNGAAPASPVHVPVRATVPAIDAFRKPKAARPAAVVPMAAPRRPLPLSRAEEQFPLGDTGTFGKF